MKNPCKVCNKKFKPKDFYVKEKFENGDLRYDRTCKVCRREANNNYRAQNFEIVKVRKQQWNKENAERLSEQKRNRRANFTKSEHKQYRKLANAHAAAMRDRRVSEYLKEHKKPPLCACGCNNRVKFSSKGTPNTWLTGHYRRPAKNDVASKQSEITKPSTNTVASDGKIPIDSFKKFVTQVRSIKGWTEEEIAIKGGIHPDEFKKILSSRSKTVANGLDRTWVTYFARRLEGLGAPPTEYQVKRFDSLNKRYRSTEPT